MEVVWIISGLAVALLLIELLAPTGGVLAVLGALGLAAAGFLAISDNSDNGDAIGGALIAAGVISLAVSVVIGRKLSFFSSASYMRLDSSAARFCSGEKV